VTPPAAGEGTAPATVKPKPVKFSAPLTVSSEPWGTLYVDDMEIGPTPVTDHVLTQGRHRLRIEQEGYRTTVDFIMVTSPNPIRREYNLEPGGP